MSETVVNAELCAGLYDLTLCHLYDRGVDDVFVLVLDGGGSSKIGECLEGGDELRSAVGIAGVVGCVYSDEDVECPEYLRPRQGVTQKYRVAGRDVGYGDVVFGDIFAVFGHFKAWVGQRGTSEGGEVDVDNAVFGCTGGGSDHFCRCDLDTVSLAVAERKAIAGKARIPGDCQSCGGIKTSAE